MNSQENERWSKRLFGTNGLFLIFISIVFLFVYEIGKNILMDYVLSRLSQHGIVFNKIVEFILDQPFLSSVSFFVIVLSALLILDYIQFQRNKVFVAKNPFLLIQKKTQTSESKSAPKKKSFTQKQKTAVDKVSKLVNDAVEKSSRFSEGYSLPNEPDMKKKAILAYNAGKELMEYFKNGNNRLYFSDNARQNIIGIYETISVCIQGMDIAMSGNFNVELWNKNLEKLRKIKVLKDELDSEFHEFLVNFDEDYT